MKDYESNAISHFHPPFAGFRSIEKDKFTDGCTDYDDGCVISTKLTTLLDKQVATADKPSTTNSTISTCPSKKPILNAAQIIPRKRILGCHDSADNSLRTELRTVSNFHPPFAGYRSIEKDKFTDGCIDYDDARSTKLATLLDKQVATADKPSTTNSTISTCPSKKPILNAAQIIPRKRILGCHDSADNSLRTELTTVSYNRVERVYIPSSTNSIILRRPNKMPNFKPKIRSLGSHIITGRRIIRRLRVSKWVKAMSDKHFS
jgi:hypothetical protein